MVAPTKAPLHRVRTMDVGAMLGVRYSTARDLMLSGKLGTPIRNGKHLEVDRAAVEAYLAKRKARK